jgi:hypothetical protein
MNLPPSTTPQSRSAQQSEAKETIRSQFLQWWRKPLPKWWVLGLGLLALGQAAYNLRPRVEITSAIPLDEHDPFATAFLIQNVGPWPLYNFVFACDVSSGMQRLHIENVVGVLGGGAPVGLGNIAKLASGESATRDCVAGPQSNLIRIPPPADPTTVRINVIIKYQWPLIGGMLAWAAIESKTSRHFSVRRSPDRQKLLLVPDTER